VLDVRAEFQNSSPADEPAESVRSGGASLADLYNPLTMLPALVSAHNELDKAVDLAYHPQPFINETKRIEYLFELYDKYTSGLFAGKNVRTADNLTIKSDLATSASLCRFHWHPTSLIPYIRSYSLFPLYQLPLLKAYSLFIKCKEV
jgi:hypothetical protein